jgi:hypothetical protein
MQTFMVKTGNNGNDHPRTLTLKLLQQLLFKVSPQGAMGNPSLRNPYNGLIVHGNAKKPIVADISAGLR